MLHSPWLCRVARCRGRRAPLSLILSSDFDNPSASELTDRLERLCTIANEAPTDETFLHPVGGAILLHHQLAHDHPFAEGHDRTARALFMWSILRAGYTFSFATEHALFHGETQPTA